MANLFDAADRDGSSVMVWLRVAPYRAVVKP
jgi:hypothetical protein